MDLGPCGGKYRSGLERILSASSSVGCSQRGEGRCDPSAAAGTRHFEGQRRCFRPAGASHCARGGIAQQLLLVEVQPCPHRGLVLHPGRLCRPAREGDQNRPHPRLHWHHEYAVILTPSRIACQRSRGGAFPTRIATRIIAYAPIYPTPILKASSTIRRGCHRSH